MYISFGAQDSIYKIIQALEKIPHYKKVTIDIDADHDIFKHQRWGTYLEKVVVKQGITAVFVAHTPFLHTFYIQSGLNCEEATLSLERKALKFGIGLIDKIKSFHTNLLIKKNYVSFLILMTEFSVLCLCLVFFWKLISPNAKVIIEPTYEIDNFVYNIRYYPKTDELLHKFKEYISVPYTKNTLNYNTDISMNVGNITYDQTIAQGTVTIFNSYPYPYSFVEGTKLITEDGITFRTQKVVNVPSSSNGKPGRVKVKLIAEKRVESGLITGELGNIEKGTELLIKNLAESRKRKTIYAIADDTFSGGSTITNGTVIQDDIDTIEKKILLQMNEGKKEFLKENFFNDTDQQKKILLPFDDLYTIDIKEFQTTSDVGENTAFIDGKIQSDLSFLTIERNDIKKAVKKHIEQRLNQENQSKVSNIDRNNITFYNLEYIEPKEGPSYYIIPTKIPLITRYNIKEDVLGIVNEIKDKVVGLPTTQAQEIMGTYDEIKQADISISPGRYSLLPSIKSRIDFVIKEG